MAATTTTGRKQRGQPKPSSQAQQPAPPSRRRDWSSWIWPASVSGRALMAGIIVVAFLLRVHNLLTMFPILVDESIYLRWAEIIDHQGQWLISLLDGKPPLHTWLLAIARMLFGGDPLLTGRAVSVLTGLLSTIGIFAIGRRMGGEKVGLIAAGLYSIFPLALLYDRLAYTEALVNLCGVAIVLTSLLAFDTEKQCWGRDSAAAIALGLGLFTKQTMILFAFFPALAGVWYTRKQLRGLITRLALIYGIGLLSLALSWILKPAAPTLRTYSTLLHHSGFYAQPSDLLANPFVEASKNFPLLGGYIATYMTTALALLAVASLIYLTVRRRWEAWMLMSVAIIPLIVQVFILSLMFPSRWVYPHLWPCFIIVGMAAMDLWDTRGHQIQSPRLRQVGLAAALLLIFTPVLLRSLAILSSPRTKLHADDATGFLGSSGHVGFGIREAADYLDNEATTRGRFVLLVDPIWGPPADAIFAYLNQRDGIQVYEAWWTQLSGAQAILPRGSAAVLRSHYERLEAGKIDFRAVPRVFYVTDTNYYDQAGVKGRQPDAQLVASFPKPDGKQAINVYRLK